MKKNHLSQEEKENLNKTFPFWSLKIEEVLSKVKTSKEGLTEKEAKKRLKKEGYNVIKPKKKTSQLHLLLNQFNSPLILLFLFTAILSIFFKEHINSIIIFTIVILSGLLGFWQERKAVHLTEKLISIVKVKSEILRAGELKTISTDHLVVGDIILLNAGDIVPADCLIFESKDLFVDESTLTGETFAIEKKEEVLAVNTLVNKRSNCLFMGSHIISGIAKAVIVSTGKKSQFGLILEQLKSHIALTDFEKSIKKISLFLMNITLVLVLIIFISNLFLQRSFITSLLFSLALAIGLVPQLLPAIISVNLSHGSRLMSKKKVIVKRISSIENFGSMNILCADKTGTLTEGKTRFHSIVSFNKKNEEKIALYSYLNSKFQTGYSNPIDQSILDQFNRFEGLLLYQKIDELPYDFSRKRLTIIVKENSDIIMITKGALFQVLDCSTSIETANDEKESIEKYLPQIRKDFEKISLEGFRALGLSYRIFKSTDNLGKEMEKEMTFLGFLVFFDPIKKDVKSVIESLKKIGINLKIITGDNRFSATHIAKELELDPKIIVGSDLNKLDERSLSLVLCEKNVFAEIEPIQKDKIITSLKKQNFVVGYLGDGINDASALHSADVGISVNTAADSAKEAADMILLDKNLKVLLDGVKEGRKTFANTLKYIFMAISSNFGNMFSMAGASLFLSFLPLLPEQILLNNLLTDIPEMTISTDSVDQELVEKPIKMNISFISKFMFVFGLISSIFDYLTFGSLLYIFKASEIEFRTGWFMESVISAASIILVIRTRKPFFKSMPSNYLSVSVFLIVMLTLFLPFSPIGKFFSFDILPFSFYLLIVIIMILYISIAEFAKKIFYKNQVSTM